MYMYASKAESEEQERLAAALRVQSETMRSRTLPEHIFQAHTTRLDSGSART